MTNLVEVTIRANDQLASGFATVKVKAAKAGAEAGKAFNDAFKLKADASIKGSSSPGGTGIAGEDKQLLNRLKGYANTPGGIGILGTGNDTSLISMLKRQIESAGQAGGLGLVGGSSQSGESVQDTIRQQLTGNSPGNVNTEDLIRQVITGNSPSNYNTSDFIKQVLQGSTPGNINTQDLIKQVLEGSTPGNINTTDFIRQVVEGHLPGNLDTTDTIHERIDDSTIKAQGEKDGKTYGSGFASSLKNALSGFLGSAGGSGGGGILSALMGGGGGGESGGGGIGDTVKGALDTGGVAVGALPGISGISGSQAAITGIAGALIAVLPAITSVIGGLAGIGGGFAILEATNKKFAADMSSTMSGIEKVFESAAAPLIKPLESAATQIGGFFKSIGPELKSVFADSAPLIQPLVKGFEALASGALPGFVAMIKDAGPAFKILGGAFADLGKSLGTMFSDFGSASGSSATVLKGFLDLVNTIFPVLGKLGAVFSSAVAPAFSVFGKSLDGVMPALEPLLSILAQLAGAVLTDLASVLGAVGTVLEGMAPSFSVLAKASGQLFSTMENTGVMASFADALENIAAPLGKLINALVQGIAPALPVIIEMFNQFYGVIIAVASDGLSLIIGALASLVKWMAPVLPLVAEGIAAWKLFTIAAGIFNTVMDMDPFVAITAAVIAVTALVIKYHTQIFGFIEKTWDDVESFCEKVWGDIVSFAKSNWLELLLGPAGFIVKYHNDIFSFIKNIWGDVESFLKGAWDSITGAASSAWHGMESALSSDWNSMYSGVKTIGGNIVSWVGGLPHAVVNALSGLGSSLESFGENAFSMLLSGIKSGAKDIVSWLQGFAKDVVNVFKTIWGWFSPSQVMYQGGKALMDGLQGGIEDHAKAAQAKAAKAAKGVTEPLPGGGDPAANAALARKMMPAWATGSMWTDWNNVAMRESGWNQFADNPGSGAYGIPQALPYTKMPKPAWPASAGGSSNPGDQISWMISYIQGRYGNPAAAWAHEVSAGWYAAGGPMHAGWNVVGESGRELVRVPGGSTAMPNANTEAALGSGGNVHITLKLGPNFQRRVGLTPEEFTNIVHEVRVRGGGDVQKAFGRQ